MNLKLTEKELVRFMSKVRIDPNTGCWHWTGAKFSRGGYGAFWFRTNNKAAHLVAYNHFVGEVAPGLELGHITKGDKCANWQHVRPVTDRENSQEAFGGTLQQCKRHHPRTPDNRDPITGGCIVCQKIHHRRREGSDPWICCGYVTCRCGELRTEVKSLRDWEGDAIKTK